MVVEVPSMGCWPTSPCCAKKTSVENGIFWDFAIGWKATTKLVEPHNPYPPRSLGGGIMYPGSCILYGMEGTIHSGWLSLRSQNGWQGSGRRGRLARDLWKTWADCQEDENVGEIWQYPNLNRLSHAGKEIAFILTCSQPTRKCHKHPSKYLRIVLHIPTIRWACAISIVHWILYIYYITICMYVHI